MRKKPISVKQPGKAETTLKRKKSQGKSIILTTDHMPDWMQQYLASAGIEREFDVSELSVAQFSAFESAERLLLYHSERAGLIRVIFDPQTDTEPWAELTDLGRKTLQSDF